MRRPALSLTTSHLALLLLLLSLSLFVAALLLPVIFAVGHDMSSRLCVGLLSATAIASVITKRFGSHLIKAKTVVITKPVGSPPQPPPWVNRSGEADLVRFGTGQPWNIL